MLAELLAHLSQDGRLTSMVADWLVAEHGLAFAIRAALECARYRIEGPTMERVEEGLLGGRYWLRPPLAVRLREHACSVDESLYEEALGAATLQVEASVGVAPRWSRWVLFAHVFPEHTSARQGALALAESPSGIEGRALAIGLLMLADDVDTAVEFDALLQRAHSVCSSVHPYDQAGLQIGDAIARFGADVCPGVLASARLPRTFVGRAAEFSSLRPVSALPSDEAFAFLAERFDRPAVQQLFLQAAPLYPVRVLRSLAACSVGRTTTAATARSHMEAIVETFPNAADFA